MNSLPEKQEQASVEYDLNRIGDALIAHAKLKEQDIERILERQKEKNILFGEAAKELGLIADKDLKKVLSEQFGYSYIHDVNDHFNKSLVAAHAPFSKTVESLRSLREQLLIRWFNQGNKSIAITSVSKADGASELLANLAILFSQLNKKTLLIDADLRQPSHQKLFGIERKVGLANILANRQGKYEIVREKLLPNLSILSAGTQAPNPQELLNRDAFPKLLSDLENVYDIILIDTSPADIGLDYLAVLSKVKAAIIVARKDKTMLADLKMLKAQLDTTQAYVVGSVFQDV
jgi:protein-tyrosine kinase